jgi:hypothetical protein
MVFASRIFLTLSVALCASAQDHSTVWDGIYTSAQAKRGESAYAAECGRCHRDDLSGYNNVLIGKRFMERWSEDQLNSFFTVVRNTMPRNAPRSLSDQAYLDITAFVLQVNGFPAGTAELTREALTGIRVEGKQGPAPVPDFSLVQVVGCLEKSATGEWIVTRATPPVRTRDPNDSAAEALKLLETTPPGSQLIHLMDPASVRANLPLGRKVEAKGFLIRKPDGQTLNPTSLQSIGTPCGP